MDDLVARAFAVSEIARICRDQPCPVLEDCAQAKQLELDIDELLALLKEQQYQLELAVVQYQNHAITLTENEINDGERRAQLIDIAARQEFVIRLSDALAQIETVIGSVRSLRNFAQDGGSWTFAALDLAKLSAALVQLDKTLDRTEGIATRPGTGLSKEDLANFSGSVAGGLTKYDAARKGLDELTAAIRAQLGSEGVSMALRNPTAAEALELSARRFRVEDSSLVDLGEILQGLLSNVAKQQLGERAKLIDDLRNDINAQASSRSAFIMSLHLLAARRAATEDAIAALEAAQRDLQNCMAAARCSPATRERQAARLPAGIGSAPGRPGERPTLNSVLPTLLTEIDRLRPRIEPVVAFNKCEPKDGFNVPLGEGLFLAHDSTTFCTFGDG
ncbi:MAG: hypothetical protein KJZ64_08745, partial [Sphingomonadaceae bacterium]|nr:hypothetical protein [Sphingomonadaceae bacterium]